MVFGGHLWCSVAIFVGLSLERFPSGVRSSAGAGSDDGPVEGPSPSRCHPCVNRSGRDPISLAMIQGARDSGGEGPRSAIIATRPGDRRASADPASRGRAGRLGRVLGLSSPRVVRDPDHRRRASRRQGAGHARVPPGCRRDLRPTMGSAAARSAGSPRAGGSTSPSPGPSRNPAGSRSATSGACRDGPPRGRPGRGGRLSSTAQGTIRYSATSLAWPWHGLRRRCGSAAAATPRAGSRVARATWEMRGQR